MNEILSFKGYYLILLLTYLALSFCFGKNALHMFQQNRYEFKRYTSWLFDFKRFKFSFLYIYILFVLICLIFKIKIVILIFVTLLLAIYLIYQENNTEYIKPLVYTKRVIRQIVVYLILGLALIILLIIYFNVYLNFILCIILPYLLIYLMALITWPFEEFIKKQYQNKAKKILDTFKDLKKIGITGSFGKTSTKNIINDLLKEKYYTLMTPASYNTPMGITKTIRESLKLTHELFICEMGADHVGEITKLMNFVRPQIGIVTSIGPQHLNTFGAIGYIIHEKMQAIEKLPADGLGIINIDNEYINNYQIQNKVNIIKVGIHNENADYLAYDLHYSKNGSTFKLKLDGKAYKFQTVLLGEHNVVNILCGIALAKYLGMENSEIVKAVANIKQIEHRLQLKEINGYTFIDNAFNSNPVGSKRSLDVLSTMPGNKIVVTPGLIDLGKEQAIYNYDFGKYMLNKADFIILVGNTNSGDIKKGAIDVGFNEENIITVSSVKEAFAYIYEHFSKNDTILLENDLPDAFLN